MANYYNSKEGRDAAHAAGLCIACRDPHDYRYDDGTRRRKCKPCTAKRAKQARARYLAWKADGLCACGRSRRAKNRSICVVCIRERHPLNKRGAQVISEKEIRFVEMKLDRLAAERRARRGASLAA